jgi:hypothetical protein
MATARFPSRFRFPVPYSLVTDCLAGLRVTDALREQPEAFLPLVAAWTAADPAHMPARFGSGSDE